MPSRIVVENIYVSCPYLKQEKPLVACYINSQEADHYCYGCEMPEEWMKKYGLRTYKRTLLKRACESELPAETTWIYAPRDTQGEKWMTINLATGERYQAGAKPVGDPNCDVCQLPYFQAHGGCTKHNRPPHVVSSSPIVTEALRTKARRKALARSDDRYGREPTKETKKRPKAAKTSATAPSVATELAREAKRIASEASRKAPKARKKGCR